MNQMFMNEAWLLQCFGQDQIFLLLAITYITIFEETTNLGQIPIV